MSGSFKRQLLEKLDNYPLLRQMVCEPWFRVIFSLCVIGMVSLVLFLPKWWRVTPKGFVPEVRISGLDLVQAWSLKRSALQAEAAGREEDAVYSWQAAVGNNRTDIELLRGSLRYFASRDVPKAKYQQFAFGQSFWLLRINHTNQTDLEIVTQVLEKYRMHGMVMYLLRPHLTELTPIQEATYLKALFKTSGNSAVEQFAARWERAGKAIAADPELPLFYAAYQAGWGSPDKASEGRDKLAEARKNPKFRVLALQLQLLVSYQLIRPNDYGDALQELTELRADSILENVNYWRVLAQAGRMEEGRKLAQDYPYPPALSKEVVEMALASMQLGLTDYARTTLKHYAPQFPYAADIWVDLGDLLLQGKLWDELRELAMQIRNQEGTKNLLFGYSYYLDGRADLATQRPDQAKEEFDRSAQYAFDDNPEIGLRTANSLLKIGYPEPARAILLRLKPELKLNVDYWKALFDVANQLKQEGLLLEAGQNAYELQKNDVNCKNNYAAALLINRTKAEEAVKLTFDLISRYPDSETAKINHALAYVQNNRLPEAKQILDTLDVAQLSDVVSTAYYLGIFEIAVDQKRPDQAWQAFDKIEKRNLFPNQIVWLERVKKDLPPRPLVKD